MGQYLQTNIRLTDSRKHLECGEALSCDGVWGGGGGAARREDREGMHSKTVSPEV